MTHRIATTPILPKVGKNQDIYDGVLNRSIFAELSEIRLNLSRAVQSGGTIPMEAPLPLASFTVAGVPAAAVWLGSIIYVSNETGGATLAFSDGTDWRRVQDRAVIA